MRVLFFAARRKREREHDYAKPDRLTFENSNGSDLPPRARPRGNSYMKMLYVYRYVYRILGGERDGWMERDRFSIRDG